ncbi:MAG: rod shape-determining protein RodA [Candidatus Omnitrophota bacterium]
MNKFLHDIDRVLIAVVVIIFIIALMSLYSASHQPNGRMDKNFTMQQVIWMGFALSLSIFVMRFGYERWLDYGYLIFAFNIFLLLLVLFIGSTRLGARRWLSLGLFTLQPSELCKISFILVLVRYVGDNHYRIGSFRVMLKALILCAVPMLLIIKQPDLGTAIVFLPIFFIVLFVAGARLRHLIIIIVTGLLSSPILWHILKDYQKKRLIVFLNPNVDPLGAGYTITQSKIAVGSGGFFGKGWMSGTQNQLNFLPERHTDFIFSVIGEEWGFLGAILLLGLFMVLLIRLLRIADFTNDLRGRLLVVSVVVLLWFQIVVNISMAIGIMPVVGLPLPMISYGGSSLMTTFILLSMALSVRLKRKIF